MFYVVSRYMKSSVGVEVRSKSLLGVFECRVFLQVAVSLSSLLESRRQLLLYNSRRQ